MPGDRLGDRLDDEVVGAPLRRRAVDPRTDRVIQPVTAAVPQDGLGQPFAGEVARTISELKNLTPNPLTRCI